MMEERLRLFSGTANQKLTENIGRYLNILPGVLQTQHFSDGEIFIQIGETIRGLDAFFIQSTSAPANDNLMELLIFMDAAKRASAHHICAVIPYFGYVQAPFRAFSISPWTIFMPHPFSRRTLSLVLWTMLLSYLPMSVAWSGHALWPNVCMWISQSWTNAVLLPTRLKL